MKVGKKKGMKVIWYYFFSIGALLLYFVFYAIFSISVIEIDGLTVYIFSFDIASFLAGLMLILLAGACFLISPQYSNRKKRSEL